MRAPHPVGARIVKLDERLARMTINVHHWQEPLPVAVPPANAPMTDARAAFASIILPRAHARQWAPAHLQAKRQPNGDVAISWVRCARSGGDSWGPGEPPIGAPSEAYQLDILDAAGALKRTATLNSPSFTYTSALQSADFGALPASLRFQVAQIGANGATGLNSALTITL